MVSHCLHAVYKNSAATPPTTIANTPCWPETIAAAALVLCCAGADALGVTVTLALELAEPVTMAAGAVVGSATPEGQCLFRGG